MATSNYQPILDKLIEISNSTTLVNRELEILSNNIVDAKSMIEALQDNNIKQDIQINNLQRDICDIQEQFNIESSTRKLRWKTVGDTIIRVVEALIISYLIYKMEIKP